MIGKSTLKIYGWTTIEEYFFYIAESVTNGQREQARDLFAKCSKEQKADALEYLKANGFNEAREVVINSLIK